MSFLRHLKEMLLICDKDASDYVVNLPEDAYLALANDLHIAVPKPVPEVQIQIKVLGFSVINAGGDALSIIPADEAA